MSTILEALRRLEADEESERQLADIGAGPESLVRVGSSARRSRPFRRLLIALVGIAFAAVVGAGATFVVLSLSAGEDAFAWWPIGGDGEAEVALGRVPVATDGTLPVAKPVVAPEVASADAGAAHLARSAAAVQGPSAPQTEAPAGAMARADLASMAGVPASEPKSRTPDMPATVIAAEEIARVGEVARPLHDAPATSGSRTIAELDWADAQLSSGRSSASAGSSAPGASSESRAVERLPAPAAVVSASPLGIEAEPIVEVAMVQPEGLSEPDPFAARAQRELPESYAATAAASTASGESVFAKRPDDALPTLQRSQIPRVQVQNTIWHPTPDRRSAVLQVEEDGVTRAVTMREGQSLGPLELSEIRPSGVTFVHEGVELEYRVGAR